MKQSVLVKMGALMLVAGSAFVVPVFAADSMGGHDHSHGASDAKSDMNESGTQQLSGMMNDMSGEMKDMSTMMEGGNMKPDTMKKMASQMKMIRSR